MLTWSVTTHDILLTHLLEFNEPRKETFESEQCYKGVNEQGNLPYI